MATLQELADLIGGKVLGNSELDISGVSEIQRGVSGTITFLSNPKYKKYVGSTQASAIIASNEDILTNKNGILVENPQMAAAKVLDYFQYVPEVNRGIHTSAVVASDADISEGVSLGPHVVIESGVKIGINTFIGANSVIGNNTYIGSKCAIHSNVNIYHGCKIGNNSTIYSGTVIGSDGFGYVEEGGIHHKFPQTGNVIIGNNVDIGANCSIDRGTIGDTIIRSDCKLDNLIHIAHNVRIGQGCLIAGQVGIAGSTEIGDFCIFAGHSGVVSHVKIGDRAIFAVKCGVTKSLPGGKIYAGMPAREIKDQHKKDAVMTEIVSIKKRLKKLEDS